MVAALLAAVTSCGVAVSAMTNSTVVGIAVVWIGVYGAGILLSVVPSVLPSPAWLLKIMPHVLHGDFHWRMVGRLVGWSALASFVTALLGMGYFSRRDV